MMRLHGARVVRVIRRQGLNYGTKDSRVETALIVLQNFFGDFNGQLQLSLGKCASAIKDLCFAICKCTHRFSSVINGATILP